MSQQQSRFTSQPYIVGGQEATYLPLHRGGPTAIQTPSLEKGINAVEAGTKNWVRSAYGLGDSIQNFGKAYAGMKEARDARNADTKAREYFRMRRADTSMLEGEQADNLLYNEQKHVQQYRGTFLDEHKELDPGIAGRSYDKYAQQYLDWSMVHMVQQSRVADDNSRFAAATELVNAASDAPLSIGSLQESFGEAAMLYEGRPQDIVRTQDKILKAFLGSWAERQPVSRNGQQGVVEWWNANEAALRPLLGSSFAGGADVIRRTKDWVTDQAWQAESRAWTRQQRGLAAYNHAQAKSITAGLGDIQQMVQNDMVPTTDDILSIAQNRGLDADAIYKLQNLAHNYLNRSQKVQSNALMSQYLPLAVNGFSPEQYTALVGETAKGNLSTSHFKLLTGLSEGSSTARERGYKPEWDIAVNSIKATLNPGGASNSLNQPAAVDQWVALETLREGITSLKDPKEIKAALRLSDPDSLVSRIISARQITPMQQMTRGFQQVTSDQLIQDSTRAFKPAFDEWKRSRGLPTGDERDVSAAAAGMSIEEAAEMWRKSYTTKVPSLAPPKQQDSELNKVLGVQQPEQPVSTPEFSFEPNDWGTMP